MASNIVRARLKTCRFFESQQSWRHEIVSLVAIQPKAWRRTLIELLRTSTNWDARQVLLGI